MGRRPGSPNTCRGCPPAAEVKVRLRCRRGPVLAGPGCHSRGHGGVCAPQLTCCTLPPLECDCIWKRGLRGGDGLKWGCQGGPDPIRMVPYAKGTSGPKEMQVPEEGAQEEARKRGEAPEKHTHPHLDLGPPFSRTGRK